MKPPFVGKNGSMTGYALVLVLIIGLFVGRFATSSIDHALGNRFLIQEEQARQGADSGLEICLRLASTTCSINIASFDVSLNYPNMATMTVYYQVTQVVGVGVASSTAYVFDRSSNPAWPDRAGAVARRSARIQIKIVGPPPKRYFSGSWSTP